MLRIILSMVLFITTSFALADLETAKKAYDKEDYATAFKLYLEEAEKGNAEAQYNVGVMYEDGRGVTQDDKNAVAWYQKAADQGHAIAQLELADLYISGRGGVTDGDKQAAILCQKSAEQGYASAQFILGFLYHTGTGVTQDRKQAVMWLQKAADQANLAAQSMLGHMYEYGEGVKVSFVIAYALYNMHTLEENYGSSQGRNRLAVRLAPELTRSQLEVAQKLSVEMFKTKNISEVIAKYFKEQANKVEPAKRKK